MRSKEVEEKIHMLKSYAGMTHKQTDNQGRPKLDQAIDTVLSYIYELEEEIERIKSVDIYKLIEDADTGQLLHKDKIRAKIKELESIIKNLNPGFDYIVITGMENTIRVLKELLGE